MKFCYALAVLAIAMAASGCALYNETPVPVETNTPEPTATRIMEPTREPTATRIVEPTREPTATKTTSPTPAKTADPRVSETMPTPTTAITESQRPGICGRTPEVQRAIIQNLEISSCRIITADELYRIRRLDIDVIELFPGDFADLPNVDRLELGLRAPDILQPGIFTGLSGLLTLRVDADRSSSFVLEQGLFDGLGELTTLDVGYINFVAAGALDDLAQLESLRLRGTYKRNSSRDPRLPQNVFRELPNLRSVDADSFRWPSSIEMNNAEVAARVLARGWYQDAAVLLDGEEVELVETITENGKQKYRLIVGDQVVKVDVDSGNN